MVVSSMNLFIFPRVFPKGWRIKLLPFLFLFSLPFFASAATSVSSFTVSPSFASSGELVAFSWMLSDSGGYSFNIPCVSGVKMQYDNGSSFPCGTTIYSTAVTNDSKGLIFYNASGGVRNVTAKIIPKDPSGTDVTSAIREASVSVSPLSNPITSFTASEIITSPGKAITISWIAPYLDGVNLQIECRSEIRAISSNYTSAMFMPCSKPIFSQDLAPSSSLSLTFSNSSPSTVFYRLTLLPAISPGSYDATHAFYLDLEIASDILPDPVVKSFNASSTAVYAGEEVSFSWKVDNAVGVNLQISCVTSVSATSSNSPEVNLACGKPAFSADFATSSSVVLTFRHKEIGSRTVGIRILPSKKAGEYDASLGREISITVRPPKVEAIVVPPQSVPSPAPIPQQVPVSPPVIKTEPPLSLPLPQSLTPPQPLFPPVPPLGTDILPETAKGGLVEQIEELLESLKQASEDYKARSLSPEKIEAVIESLVSGGMVDTIESYHPVIVEGEDQIDKHEFIGIKKAKLFYFFPVTLRIRIEVDGEGEVKEVKKPWWSFIAF